MHHCLKAAVAAVVSTILVASASNLWAQDASTVTIATAPVAGLFYPSGGAICRAVAAGRERHGIRCLVEATTGSEENLKSLLADNVDIAIVQSDWLYYARNGIATYTAQNDGERLRRLFSLKPQALTVVVKQNSEIKQLADLKGHTINLGPAGSSQRVMAEVLLGTVGLKPAEFKGLTALPPRGQLQAFCAGSIDGFIQAATYPMRSVNAAIEVCGGRLVAVEGRRVRGLVKDNPFLLETAIPGDLYPRHPEPTATIALGTEVVTSRDMPDEVVREVVRAIAEDLDGFKLQHPAFESLTLNGMFEDVPFIDTHPAVKEYLSTSEILK